MPKHAGPRLPGKSNMAGMLGIPWGISESAFNDRFLEGDYRYQSFGVPGLGLKRGLENDQVVAPYATIMATMIAPREALANLRRLASEGAEGPFGFYEAVDYTPGRRSSNGRAAVVRSYMAHHQGMSLVALANALCDDVMPQAVSRRAHGPRGRLAASGAGPSLPADRRACSRRSGSLATGSTRKRRTAEPSPHLAATRSPRTHLLSNTRYHVMITNAGSGFSRCQGLDVTRWREDPTCELWGQFFYVRDLETGAVWSAGHQPVCRRPIITRLSSRPTRPRFAGVTATSRRRWRSRSLPSIWPRFAGSPLTNLGNQPRELELTSYLEPVLLAHASDLSHPAFQALPRNRASGRIGRPALPAPASIRAASVRSGAST